MTNKITWLKGIKHDGAELIKWQELGTVEDLQESANSFWLEQ